MQALEGVGELSWVRMRLREAVTCTSSGIYGGQCALQLIERVGCRPGFGL